MRLCNYTASKYKFLIRIVSPPCQVTRSSQRCCPPHPACWPTLRCPPRREPAGVEGRGIAGENDTK